MRHHQPTHVEDVGSVRPLVFYDGAPTPVSVRRPVGSSSCCKTPMRSGGTAWRGGTSGARSGVTRYTARTLAYARKLGWSAGVVERIVPTPGRSYGIVRRDLFQAIDVIACNPSRRKVVGIQSTSFGELTRHVRQYASEGRPELEAFLASGGLFEVWGWRKVRNRWRVRRERMSCGPEGWSTRRVLGGDLDEDVRGAVAPTRRCLVRSWFEREGLAR